MLQFIKTNKFIVLCILSLLLVGGRSYYWLTDGFSIDNIMSELPYDPKLDIAYTKEERSFASQILSQPFYYLGKGCQSYVFASEDGCHVLKFFKYQRYKTKPWLDWLTFIPYFHEYRQQRMAHKQKKIEKFLNSWAAAYNNIKEDTGLVYVHLNKMPLADANVVIYDKMGFKHIVDLSNVEFMIQKKADMICPYIENLMTSNKVGEAKVLLSHLVNVIVQEYRQGVVDYDNALMQNTGVLQGRPMHVDLGQIAIDENAKESREYCQALFNKTYKFRQWLESYYPELNQHLETEVRNIIGSSFDSMTLTVNH